MYIELEVKYLGKKSSLLFRHPKLKSEPIRFGGPGSTVWLKRKDAVFLNSLSVFELTGAERIISEPKIELHKPKTITEKIPGGVKIYQKMQTLISNMGGIIKTVKSFEHLKETVNTLNELKLEKDKLQDQLGELNKQIPGLLLAQEMMEGTAAQVDDIKNGQEAIREELGEIKKTLLEVES